MGFQRVLKDTIQAMQASKGIRKAKRSKKEAEALASKHGPPLVWIALGIVTAFLVIFFFVICCDLGSIAAPYGPNRGVDATGTPLWHIMISNQRLGTETAIRVAASMRVAVQSIAAWWELSNALLAFTTIHPIAPVVLPVAPVLAQHVSSVLALLMSLLGTLLKGSVKLCKSFEEWYRYN
ncbi:hypothetical protein COCOBI_18-1040 [Coccomyxa sp. Obi]|nr:hypothetical protein COCOBI_18-1040 [Coccomyxa sp. Obi]